VLAELSFRDLVPAIWLPDPQVRRERELARFRLHLVRHRSSLKNRIHSTLITFGKPCPASDLFGVAGRKLLEHLQVPEPWRENVEASVELIDQLDRQIDAIASELKYVGADHPYVDERARRWLAGWVLDRVRDRRHQPVLLAQRALRLQRPVPAGDRSPGKRTGAGRSQSTAPNTCAGRCSRPR
jgi:hypothetical protein